MYGDRSTLRIILLVSQQGDKKEANLFIAILLHLRGGRDGILGGGLGGRNSKFCRDGCSGAGGRSTGRGLIELSPSHGGTRKTSVQAAGRHAMVRSNPTLVLTMSKDKRTDSRRGRDLYILFELL